MGVKKIVALLAALVVSPAFAISLSTSTSISQTPGPFSPPLGAPVTDADSAAAGYIASTSTVPSTFGTNIDFGGSPYAFAEAGDLGAPETTRESGVEIDGWMYDGADLWAFEAVADTSITVVNTTGGNAAFTFDYYLNAFGLFLSDFSAGGPIASVGFEFSLFIDGAPELSGTASLYGGTASSSGLLINGHWPSPVLTIDPNYPGGNIYGYLFDPLSDTIDLGILADGASVTVDTHMRAYLETPGYEIGGRFAGGAYEGTVTVDPLGPPIPEPTSLVLLGLGCLGLAGRQYRTKRR